MPKICVSCFLFLCLLAVCTPGVAGTTKVALQPVVMAPNACVNADQSLSNGVPFIDSIDCATMQGGWKYYSFFMPTAMSVMTVQLYGLSADADLYVAYGYHPDLATYDCRPYLGGTTAETCTSTYPNLPGSYWVGINNFSAGLINYTVEASWTDAGCLLCDYFEDDIMPGWYFAKGSWLEHYGFLMGSATKKAIALASPVLSGCSNCSISGTLATGGGVGNRVSMLGWYADKGNSVELMMKQEVGKFVLKQRANGKVVAKNKISMAIAPDQDFWVTMAFDGTKFDVYVDDGLGPVLFTVNKAAGTNPFGTVGFQAKATTGYFGYMSVNNP